MSVFLDFGFIHEEVRFSRTGCKNSSCHLNETLLPITFERGTLYWYLNAESWVLSIFVKNIYVLILIPPFDFPSAILFFFLLYKLNVLQLFVPVHFEILQNAQNSYNNVSWRLSITYFSLRVDGAGLFFYGTLPFGQPNQTQQYKIMGYEL